MGNPTLVVTQMNRIKLAILTAAAALPAASLLVGSALGPNLIANDDFTAGVAGWDDYGGNPQEFYDSMVVTNDYEGTGNSYKGAWYCVKVTAGVEYLTMVDYLVLDSAPANSGASLGLHYYTNNTCTGASAGSGGYQEGGKLAAQRGEWKKLSFENVAPAAAKSVRVRVSAIKEPKPSNSSITEDHYAFFDNAYFGKTTLVLVPADPGNPTNTPTATPTSAPTVTPTAVPTVVPTAVPTDGLADDPAPVDDEEDSDGPQDSSGPNDGGEKGSNEQAATSDEPPSNGPKNGGSAPRSPNTPPLPPSTGDGEVGDDSVMMLMLASIALMVTGAGLIALLLSRRRRQDQ